MTIVYSVYCSHCGAYLGESAARFTDDPEEWACSVCMTRTYPNTHYYDRQLIRQGKCRDERDYVYQVQTGV